MCPSSCPSTVKAMAIDHRRLLIAVKGPLRMAGALYLLMVVLGGVAQLVARAGIRLPGAATSAGQHMDAQPATSQVSIVADIAMAALFISVGSRSTCWSGTSTGTPQGRRSSSSP